RSARPPPAELDAPPDRGGVALEHCLDAAVQVVAHPARDALDERAAAERVAERHTLNASADHDSPPARHAESSVRANEPPPTTLSAPAPARSRSSRSDVTTR